MMKRHRSRHSSHRSSSPQRSRSQSQSQSLSRSKADLKSDGKGKRPRRSRHHESTERLKLPFDLKCKGCNGTTSKGFTLNATKKSVTKEIWNFTVECGYCGHKLVLERTQEPVFKIIEGAKTAEDELLEDDELDIEAWKEKRSREIFDEINPSLSGRRCFFKMYQIGVTMEDPEAIPKKCPIADIVGKYFHDLV